MHSRSLLQAFALDNEGRVRSVEEVSRGLSCDCKCPGCGTRVIAKQGDQREWHFAHASGVECPGAAESALHQAAKQVLVESEGLMIPEQVAHVNVHLTDGRSGTGAASRPPLWLDFVSAELESTIHGLRPDVLVRVGDRLLAIEIAVTHYVENQKAQRLAQCSLAALEIDLAAAHGEPWTWATLRQTVIDEVSNKTWIHNFDYAALEAEARAAAVRAAFPVAGATGKPVAGRRRKRHYISGRIVDLIELPFGVALWAPYDPTINQLIKSLVYPLGGRWQPKFKNWLVPLGGKQLLEQQLTALSDSAPTMIESL